MKKILITVIVVVLVGAILWAVWSSIGSGGNGQQAGQMPPAAVSTITLETRQIPVYEILPGRVSPFKQAEIRPQASGIIVERLFEGGSTVETGQQLYQIDPAPYEAALASAEADLKSAQANVTAIEARAKRYEKLVKIKAVSAQEYDDIIAQLNQARAAIAVAEAAVDVAKVNLAYTKVYAPISGKIGKSLVTEGALVTANQQQPLAVITQLDPVYVDLTQSSAEMMQMRRQLESGNQPLPVHLLMEDRNRSYERAGELQFSDVTVDETTGSVQLRAIFPNPDGILLPGLFVRAKVSLGTRDVILVPQQAAIRGPDGSLSVWIVNPQDNTVAPAPVTVAEAYGNQWIVTSGVDENTVIVVEGFQKIAPGATVTPAEWKPEPDGAETMQKTEPAA